MQRNGKQLLTVPETADFLGLKERRVYVLSRSDLACCVVRLGRSLFFSRPKLEALVGLPAPVDGPVSSESRALQKRRRRIREGPLA